ncbi:MAG TPA: hypothetical protein VFG50_08970 [Rhodothermales bacterium]|nr:hypothetical protein [Rhodothermales bacterium]
MRRLPPSVFVIGALFLALGVLDVYRGLAPLFRGAGPVRLAGDDTLVLAIGIAALLSATFLFRARNWARWLLVAWMGLHVALSVLHPAELLAHLVIFGLMLYVLFRPPAAAFFRRPTAEGPSLVPSLGTAPLPENTGQGADLAGD